MFVDCGGRGHRRKWEMEKGDMMDESEKRGLPLDFQQPRIRRIATICVIFGIAWTAYFAIFHDIRLLRGSSPDDWYHVFHYLPLILSACIRYGLVVPFVTSTIHGAISFHIDWRQFAIDWFLLLAIFLLIVVAFEFAFEHHPVAMWKFYLLFFPPFCFVGALTGRFGRAVFAKF